MSEQLFEMSKEQLERVMVTSSPYMVFGGIPPESTQSQANRKWMALGNEMEFDWQTVRPSPRGARFFYAAPKEAMPREVDAAARCGEILEGQDGKA